MPTLNQIVEELASRVNQEDNHEYKERLKDVFKNILAVRLRQDIERNGIGILMTKKYTLPLVSVDLADDCAIDVDCDVLRTNNTIVKPVRLKRRMPFKFIGTPRGAPYTYIALADLEDFRSLRYIGKEIYYTYANGYLYVYNNKKLEWLTIEAVYTELDLLPICSGDGSVGCYTDDGEFPVPADMIESIKQEIMTKVLRVMPEKDEVLTEVDKTKTDGNRGK